MFAAGLDNVIHLPDEVRDKVGEATAKDAGGVSETGHKLKVGELEFEAMMRHLDNMEFMNKALVFVNAANGFMELLDDSRQMLYGFDHTSAPQSTTVPPSKLTCTHHCQCVDKLLADMEELREDMRSLRRKMKKQDQSSATLGATCNGFTKEELELQIASSTTPSQAIGKSCGIKVQDRPVHALFQGIYCMVGLHARLFTGLFSHTWTPGFSGCYRTSYVYRQPFVRHELKPKSDVAQYPATSTNFTYIYDNEFEKSK
ncbi:putative alpha-adducin-like isoform X5 [Apostichopus japonicus]|uniref:Putative alpha-adducin-like isoform X5 n=1 Tax=Stichopus japonicus TaxID=307972 RepID=A0A2G8JS65_STIJA|nr:putative alpha-adducin-like isoform X5 [Apostichopus japonicus]